jgi:HSP20 family protein
MAISRWTPIGELTDMHTAMDRLFGDLLQGGVEGMTRDVATFRLPVDITESEEGYEIRAPVPGFKPEDVEVTVTDGVLTINAKHSEEKTERKKGYLRREVATGNFIRQIALPGDIRAQDIKAAFDNGELTITVPRMAKPKPHRVAVERSKEKTKELPVKASSSKTNSGLANSSSN